MATWFARVLVRDNRIGMGATQSSRRKAPRAAAAAALPDFCGPLRTGELRVVLGGKSYVNHFYALKGRRLTQYASARSSKALAIFDCTGVRIDSVDPKLNRRGLVKKRRDIELVSDGVVWLWLRAPDEAQQRQWVKALRKAAALRSEKKAMRATRADFGRRLDAIDGGATAQNATAAAASSSAAALHDAIDEHDFCAVETGHVEELAREHLFVADEVALELLREYAWDFDALQRAWRASEPRGESVLARARIERAGAAIRDRNGLDGAEVAAAVERWDTLVAACESAGAGEGDGATTSHTTVHGGDAADEADEGEEECPVCYADDVEVLRLPGCGHGVCRACWRSAARAAHASGAASVKCQEAGCRGAVQREHLGALLSAPQRDAIAHFRAKRLVALHPRARFCPNPKSCDLVVRVRDRCASERAGEDEREDGRERTDAGVAGAVAPDAARDAAAAAAAVLQREVDVRCACAFEFCFACTNDPHGPTSCAQRARWLEMVAEFRGRGSGAGGARRRQTLQRVDAAWFESNTKPCPRCKMPIQKVRIIL